MSSHNNERFSRSRKTVSNCSDTTADISKFRRLPSIRSTAGVNYSSSKKFTRSRSMDCIHNSDISYLRNDKILKSLSPIHYVNSRFNQPSRVPKTVYSPRTNNILNGQSQPGRFSYGVSKSLPPSGGSSNNSRRGSYIGDYNNNTHPLYRAAQEALVLPQLYVKSSFDGISPRNLDSRATFIMKSRSTNSIDDKPRKKQNGNKQKSKKLILPQEKSALATHNIRKCASNEHLPTAGTQIHDFNVHKKKQNTNDSIDRRLAPLNLARNSNSINRNRIKKPGKENFATAKQQPNTYKRKPLYQENPTYRLPNRQEFNKYSRYSERPPPQPSNPSEKPPSSEAVAVTVVGRTLTSTTAHSQTTAWSDHKFMPSKHFMKYSTINEVDTKQTSVSTGKPKLTRNLTYDVIDSKMSNLPIIDPKAGGNGKSGRRSAELVRRRRYGSR